MIRLVAKRLPAIGALSTVSPIEASHHPRSVAALVGGQLGGPTRSGVAGARHQPFFSCLAVPLIGGWPGPVGQIESLPDGRIGGSAAVAQGLDLRTRRPIGRVDMGTLRTACSAT